MNLDVISNFLQSGSGSTGRSLVVNADSEFNLTLELGQVLKGKVLRHYEGGRYSVSFGGQEKVVDSTSPLRVGEIIHGRVVGIDDKVHLQRIVAGALNQDEKASGARLVPEQRDAIAALFARYQVPLTPEQHAALRRVQSQLGGSKLLGPSALIVRKLGLPNDPVLLKAINQVLHQARSNEGVTTGVGPSIEGGLANGAIDSGLVMSLAPLLARLVEQSNPQPTTLATTSEEDRQSNATATFSNSDDHQESKDDQLWRLGNWLINIQNEGSQAHRHLRFPLWLNDRMIEVGIAFYSQEHGLPGSASGENSLRHRKVVFSLATENMGTIEVEALVAGQHLRLSVNTEKQFAAEMLGTHLTVLTSTLARHGWHVDEILYRAKDDLSGVMQSIVEHHVLPDSLSRLM